jgi:hypothetical protein
MIGDRSVVVAVFPQLPAGSYRIHPDRERAGTSLEIIGGRIAELDLRTS